MWDKLRDKPQVLAAVLSLIDQECIASGWSESGESWERRVWGDGGRTAHVFYERGSGQWLWRVGDGIATGRTTSVEEAKRLVDDKLRSTGWLLLP